jgi:hypothetical protein
MKDIGYTTVKNPLATSCVAGEFFRYKKAVEGTFLRRILDTLSHTCSINGFGRLAASKLLRAGRAA